MVGKEEYFVYLREKGEQERGVKETAVVRSVFPFLRPAPPGLCRQPAIEKILKIVKNERNKKKGCQDIGSEVRMWPDGPTNSECKRGLVASFPLNSHVITGMLRMYPCGGLAGMNDTNIGVPTSPTTKDCQ